MGVRIRGTFGDIDPLNKVYLGKEDPKKEPKP